MNKPIEPVAMPRNVFQRLSDARAEFHTLKLEKTGHNKFAGYMYFTLADILMPALNVFHKHGLCAIVNFQNNEASMVVRCVDNPQDFFTIAAPLGSALLKGCHEVQNIGAVQTYQRRYMWLAALEIVEHDALDSSEIKTRKPKTVAKMELEGMPEDEQKFLADMAAGVLEFWPDEEKTFDAYTKAKKGLDSDEQTAFWSFFDSKQRSAIKRIGQMQLAGQA